MAQHGIGINIGSGLGNTGTNPFGGNQSFGGGGGGIESLLGLLGGQQQQTGLAGLLGGPFGSLFAGLGGGLIGGIGSLLAGDGGRGKRLREAQGSARGLLNSEVDQGQLLQLMSLFDKSQGPKLNRLFSQAAGRVGLGSGIGQAFALNRIQDDRASFSTQSLLNAINRVSQNKRLGAQLQAGLVNG